MFFQRNSFGIDRACTKSRAKPPKMATNYLVNICRSATAFRFHTTSFSNAIPLSGANFASSAGLSMKGMHTVRRRYG
jgi:hypothetical protein